MALENGSEAGGFNGNGGMFRHYGTEEDGFVTFGHKFRTYGTKFVLVGTNETTQYINRVYDPGAGGRYVPWTTTGFIDVAGSQYPNPYGSGYGACSGHCVIGIVPKGL